MRVQFSVPFEEAPEESLDLAAYVTDRRTGDVIASKPIKEGRFDLDLDEARVHGLSISIAPVRPDLGDALPTRSQLERLRAYEPVFRFDPKLKKYDLQEIPAELSRFWWLCFCRVRGKVVKPVTSGGVTVDMPVCHARVHICEVDPIWIILERLPDPDIFRLRDDLLEVIERPIPVPPEPPWPIGPEPGPGPIGPSTSGRSRSWTSRSKVHSCRPRSKSMLGPRRWRRSPRPQSDHSHSRCRHVYRSRLASR